MFILIALFTISFNSFAANELLNMSLEELLNVKVQVSTKEPISLKNAPNSITVYTETDINNLGYYTLKELASITTGFSSANIFAGQSNLIVRGQKVEGFDNNKVLVLKDNIPLNHLRNGRAPIDNDLSLIGVERVEFLRGPASSLYGSGAFLGVINIITKKSTINTNETFAQVYLGSHNTQGFRAYAFNQSESTRSQFRFAGHQRNQTGTLIGYKTDSKDYDNSKSRSNSGFDTIDDYHLDISTQFKNGFLKNFELGFIKTKNQHGTFETDSDFNRYSYLFDFSTYYLKFDKALNKNKSFHGYLRYNTATEEGLRYKYSFLFSGYDLLGEYHHTLDPKNKLIWGVSLDSRRLENYANGTTQQDGTGSNAFIEKGSNPLNTYSAYMQFFHGDKDYSITLGTRFDKVQSDFAEANKFSPRLAAVKNISDQWATYFNISTALRGPDLKSTLINAGVLEEGNSLKQDVLDAETATSYEIGIKQFSKQSQSKLSLFYSVIENAINRREFDSKDSYRNDKGETISYGLEFENKFIYSKNKQFFANLSYAKSQLPDEDSDSNLNGQEIGGAPTVSLNLGLTVTEEKFMYSILGKHINQFRTDDNSDYHPGFTLVDLNSKYTYSRDVSFQFKIENIFNIDARVPDKQEQVSPQTILFQLNYKF